MDEVIIRAQELNKTFSLKRGKRVEALKDLDLTGSREIHLYAAYSGIDGSYIRKAVRIGAGQRQRGANNPAPHFLYATKIWPL